MGSCVIILLSMKEEEVSVGVERSDIPLGV